MPSDDDSAPSPRPRLAIRYGWAAIRAEAKLFEVTSRPAGPPALHEDL